MPLTQQPRARPPARHPPQVKQQLLDPATRQRLESIEQYVASDSSFPQPPPVPKDEGVALQDWMPREPDVINV